jgi:hypothetical protein
LAGLDVGGQLASNLPIWPIGQHLANWRPICQLAAIKIWTSGQPIANPIQLGLASNWSPIQMGHPGWGGQRQTKMNTMILSLFSSSLFFCWRFVAFCRFFVAFFVAFLSVFLDVKKRNSLLKLGIYISKTT